MRKRFLILLLLVSMVLNPWQWVLESMEVQAADSRNLTQTETVTVESPQASAWAANEAIWGNTYEKDDFPYIPKRLIDGKCESTYGFYISSNMTNQTDSVTITIAFEKYFEINSLTLWPAIEGGKVSFFPVDFTLQVMNKYGLWENVKEVSDYQMESTGGQQFDMEPVAAKGVRLVATKLGTKEGDANYALYMSEIEVYGTDTTTTQWPNIALAENGTIASSNRSDEGMASKGYTLGAVNDGIAQKGTPSFLSYESSTINANVEVQLDFDDWYSTDMVMLMPHVEGERVVCFPKDFTISALTPEGWKVVRQVEDYEVSGNGKQTFGFAEVAAQAVKITATELTQNNTTKYTAYAFYLNEMEVYGIKTSPEFAEPVYSNIALASNGVTASSDSKGNWAVNNGYTADKLNDGSMTNKAYMSNEYKAAEQKVTIQLDFHNYYHINEVCFYPFIDVATKTIFGFPTDFYIQVHTTEGWETVLTIADYHAVENKNAFAIQPVDCSGIRMVTEKLTVKAGSTTSYCIGIAEIEVQGIESELYFHEASGSWENIAVNQHTAAGKVSGQDLDSGAVNDGNRDSLYTGTRYEVPEIATGEYVLMNLDKPHRIGRICFYTNHQEGKTYGFPTDFVIRTYSDGVWTNVIEKENFISDRETVTLEFPDVKAERIELYITGLSETSELGQYGVQLKEMEVYGVPTATSSSTDLNMNGINDLQDGDVLREIIVEKRTLVFKDGDCNSDGCIDARDLVALKGYHVPKTVTAQTVYYVDSNAGSGGDGLTKENPLCTLEDVNQLKLQAGDAVLFARGSKFTGQLLISYSGTTDAPIIYGAYGEGALPQIHGEGKVDATVYGENVSFITIQELEVTNAGDTTEFHRGIYLLAASDNIYGIRIQNCYVHDVDSNVTEPDMGADSVITALRLADPHWVGGIVVRAGAHTFPCSSTLLRSLTVNDVVIQGNRVERCMQTGIAAGGILGAAYESKGICILGNDVRHCYGDGIILFSSHAGLIEGNLSDSNADNDVPKSAFAGIWNVQSSGDLMQYNESRNMGESHDGQGFDVDGGCFGTLVQYNYSHDNYGGALLLMQLGSGGVTVRNNISQNDGRFAINIGAANTAPYLNFEAYHNIIYTDLSTSVISFMAIIDGVSTDTLGSMRRNIVYATGSAKMTQGNIGTYVSFDENVYYGLSVYGKDANPYTEDPQFAAPGTAGDGMLSLSGYALTDTSPYLKWGIR